VRDHLFYVDQHDHVLLFYVHQLERHVRDHLFVFLHDVLLLCRDHQYVYRGVFLYCGLPYVLLFYVHQLVHHVHDHRVSQFLLLLQDGDHPWRVMLFPYDVLLFFIFWHGDHLLQDVLSYVLLLLFSQLFSPCELLLLFSSNW